MHKLSRAEHIDVRTAAKQSRWSASLFLPTFHWTNAKYPRHVPHHMMPNALLPWTRTPWLPTAKDASFPFPKRIHDHYWDNYLKRPFKISVTHSPAFQLASIFCLDASNTMLWCEARYEVHAEQGTELPCDLKSPRIAPCTKLWHSCLIFILATKPWVLPGFGTSSGWAGWRWGHRTCSQMQPQVRQTLNLHYNNFPPGNRLSGLNSDINRSLVRFHLYSDLVQWLGISWIISARAFCDCLVPRQVVFAHWPLTGFKKFEARRKASFLSWQLLWLLAPRVDMINTFNCWNFTTFCRVWCNAPAKSFGRNAKCLINTV